MLKKKFYMKKNGKENFSYFRCDGKWVGKENAKTRDEKIGKYFDWYFKLGLKLGFVGKLAMIGNWVEQDKWSR